VAAIADGDAALQNQLQALQADLQSVMAQVNGLTAENQDQAAQISQLNQALGNETAARQAADVNLANQINQLGSAISSIQSVNAQQAAAITDHEARLDALEALVLP
jgi:chromosome segregation ATPase